jgi:hypothetical protein
MLAHLRMEAYGAYGQPMYPGGLTQGQRPPTLAGNEQAIAAAKQRVVERGTSGDRR